MRRLGRPFLLLILSVDACVVVPPPVLPLHPNLLVILADDHSADVFGAYGSRTARTPNLDRLAIGGVRFDRAYAAQPVCTPSRQSMLTGLYPHAIGVTLLNTPLKEGALTLPRHLGPYGYRSAAIGKMHFNSPLAHGFDLRVDTSEHQAWLKAHPPRPVPPGVRVRGPWRPFKDPARAWLNAEVLPEERTEEDTAAAFFVRSAADFMKAPKERPFLLWLSFYEPHSPFNFPIEYAGRFDPAQMEVPPVGPEDPPQIPLIFRDLTDAEKRGIAAAYHTSAAFMDAMVGRALDAVRGLGLERDTIVVYAGDHGYHLGHHGRFEKHCFYERAVRAPLVFSSPDRLPAGRVVKGLVELVDLFPTLCELAGVPPPAKLHGRSLVPLLRGDTEEGRPWAFSTYTQNEEAMVRTPEWKLVYGTGRVRRDDGYVTDDPTPGRYRKLYNLQVDPEEMRNLADSRPEIVQKLQGLLHERLRETWPEAIPVAKGISQEEVIDFMLRPPEKMK